MGTALGGGFGCFAQVWDNYQQGLSGSDAWRQVDPLIVIKAMKEGAVSGAIAGTFEPLLPTWADAGPGRYAETAVIEFYSGRLERVVTNAISGRPLAHRFWNLKEIALDVGIGVAVQGLGDLGRGLLNRGAGRQLARQVDDLPSARQWSDAAELADQAIDPAIAERLRYYAGADGSSRVLPPAEQVRRALINSGGEPGALQRRLSRTGPAADVDEIVMVQDGSGRYGQADLGADARLPIRYAPAQKSGLQRRLQRAIVESLGKSEVIGVRPRPYRATGLEPKYPAKEGWVRDWMVANKYDNGVRQLLDADLIETYAHVRKVEGGYQIEVRGEEQFVSTLVFESERARLRGQKVLSDLDVAGLTRGGRRVDDPDFETGYAERLNKAYGHEVIVHGALTNAGPEVWEMLGQTPGRVEGLLKQDVYVFDRSGFVEALPYEDYVAKYIDKTLLSAPNRIIDAARHADNTLAGHSVSGYWLGQGDPPAWGNQMAEQTDEIYKLLSTEVMNNSTVGLTQASGKVYVTIAGRRQKSGMAQLQEAAIAFGYEFVPNPDNMHAERLLYETFKNNPGFRGIGISHMRGPCTKGDNSCKSFFEGISFENLFWTGKRK